MQTEFCQRRYNNDPAYWNNCSLGLDSETWICDSPGHDYFRNGFIYQIGACAGGSTNNFQRQISFDLTVTDVSKNPISGATVTLKDAYNATTFTTTTAADGTITQQWITIWKLYTGGTQAVPSFTYTPFELTISKTGYRTAVIPVAKPAEIDNSTTKLKYQGMKLLHELAAGDTTLIDSTIYDSIIY
jgi:hypothetical protein